MITEKIMIKGLINLFRNNIQKLYRLPKSMILDRGPVRYSSHQDGSPQNELRDVQTCGMTLASAYVLHHLSTIYIVITSDDREKSKMEVSADLVYRC